MFNNSNDARDRPYDDIVTPKYPVVTLFKTLSCHGVTVVPGSDRGLFAIGQYSGKSETSAQAFEIISALIGCIAQSNAEVCVHEKQHALTKSTIPIRGFLFQAFLYIAVAMSIADTDKISTSNRSIQALPNLALN